MPAGRGAPHAGTNGALTAVAVALDKPAEQLALEVLVAPLEDVPVLGRFVGVDRNIVCFMVAEPPEAWAAKGDAARR